MSKNGMDRKDEPRSKKAGPDEAKSKMFSPKVIVTFLIAVAIFAIVMALNHNLFDWYNPLFGG